MKTITAIIETPKGSSEKYDWKPEHRCFKLSKILPAGMVFPYDFGFIPGTKGEDGDPLDILIISEFKSFTGCMMECKVIGGIKAKQTEGNKTIRNDRFIAIPVQSCIFEKINEIQDLPKKITDEIEDFFINYNKISGKVFKAKKKIRSAEALKMIHQNG